MRPEDVKPGMIVEFDVVTIKDDMQVEEHIKGTVINHSGGIYIDDGKIKHPPQSARNLKWTGEMDHAIIAQNAPKPAPKPAPKKEPTPQPDGDVSKISDLAEALSNKTVSSVSMQGRDVVINLDDGSSVVIGPGKTGLFYTIQKRVEL